jgi:hypothetical protein
MSLPATDNFAGTGALSGSWTVQEGTPARLTGAFNSSAGSTQNTAFWNADVFNNDQYSQCIVDVNNYKGPSVRNSADTGANTDQYWWVSSISTGVCYLRVNAGFTSLFSANCAAGNLAKITATGTSIECFDAGVSQGSAVDATLASGSAGLGTYGTSGNADDWEGGNIGAVGGGSTFYPPMRLRQAVKRASFY